MIYVIHNEYFVIDRSRKDVSNIINLQVSIFCNKHIEPTPEKITTLMGKINLMSKLNFLPNIVNGQNIDILTKRVTNISNLAFTTANQQFQILCMDNRIDIIFNTNADVALDYKRHIVIAESILKLIMDEEEIIGNRLAFNIQIIGAKSIGDVSAFVSKYGKPLSFYENRAIEEWVLRYNSREPIDMAGKSETLNVVTNLSIVQNVDTAEKRILCHMDINTLAEQATFRFSSDSVTLYIAAITPIIDAIKTNFESVENDQ